MVRPKPLPHKNRVAWVRLSTVKRTSLLCPNCRLQYQKCFIGLLTGEFLFNVFFVKSRWWNLTPLFSWKVHSSTWSLITKLADDTIAIEPGIKHERDWFFAYSRPVLKNMARFFLISLLFDLVLFCQKNPGCANNEWYYPNRVAVNGNKWYILFIHTKYKHERWFLWMNGIDNENEWVS